MIELKSPFLFGGRVIPAGTKIGYLTKVQEKALVEAENAVYIRQQEDVLSPKNGGETPPEAAEVTSPKNGGETPPEAAEVTSPENGGEAPPEATEVMSPTSREETPPEAAEVTSPESVGIPQKLGRDGRGGR